MRIELNAKVLIVVSGEQGTVIGRVEYEEGEPGYLLRYKRADGCAADAWWPESAIERMNTSSPEG